jgi:hypothetical protein
MFQSRDKGLVVGTDEKSVVGGDKKGKEQETDIT